MLSATYARKVALSCVSKAEPHRIRGALSFILWVIRGVLCRPKCDRFGDEENHQTKADRPVSRPVPNDGYDEKFDSRFAP